MTKKLLMLVLLMAPFPAAAEDHNWWWLINFGAMERWSPPGEICQKVETDPETLAFRFFGVNYRVIDTAKGYRMIQGADLRTLVLSPSISGCLDIARAVYTGEATPETFRY